MYLSSRRLRFLFVEVKPPLPPHLPLTMASSLMSSSLRSGVAKAAPRSRSMSVVQAALVRPTWCVLPLLRPGHPRSLPPPLTANRLHHYKGTLGPPPLLT